MTFGELSAALAELEKTSSRKELTQLLAAIFGRADPDAIAPTIYLLQGRVAPVYEPIEMGMAEKAVIQTLARTFDVLAEEVLARFRDLGDLGNLAEELRRQYAGEADDVPIAMVFDELLALAQVSGSGSGMEKSERLGGLLRRLDPLSDRYLVRIVLSRLRLGVGDPTILDALVTARSGDRETKRILEAAYNRTSDLGLVARTFWDGGTGAAAALQIQVEHPVRPQLAERLPTPEAVITRLGTVVVQNKYDGIRVQIHKDGDSVRLFSRNMEDLTDMFPEVAAAAVQQVQAESVILDGEALAYNPLSEEFLPFQMTTRRRRRYNIAELAEELPVSAFVFDILYKEGAALVDLPLTERLRVLQETIQSGGALRAASSQTESDAEKLTRSFDDAISKGLEGLVVKRPDAPYQAGARNFTWVKLKRHSAGALEDTVDCVLLGLFAGRGKRAGFGAGALLVGLYDEARDQFVTVSRIGTGLKDGEWREIYRRSEPLRVDQKPARVDSLIVPTIWVEPEIVIEVLADEITRSPIHTAGRTDDELGYALRFPRLISFRGADKRPEDATTVRELIEMYRHQGAGRSGAQRA